MACPICRKETDRAYRPFCSRRCADIDLGRWLTGAYAIAGDPPEAGDDPANATGVSLADAPLPTGDATRSRRH